MFATSQARERERGTGTRRGKGGDDFFIKGIYVYLYWEGIAKKQSRESVTGTSRSFMEQNSCNCSKREGEMNGKRSEKGWQTEERRTKLSVCS